MNSKPNIALFAPSIGFGGTERVVGRFANELVKYYNVTLVVLYNRIDQPIHKDVNIICITKKEAQFSDTQFKKTMLFIKSVFKYQKIIKQNNIAISISFLVKQNVVNTIAGIFNSKLKTIISERCFPSNTYGGFGKNIIHYFYNKSDYLFSNSFHINTDLKTNFKVETPAHVIYNPIHTHQEKPNSLSYNKESSPFKIIAVGRLNPVKNYASLIHSMKLLNSTYELNLFGIGVLEEDLKTLSTSLKLDNIIHFKGISETINTEILQHHCLVLTSLSEGFPNVILEAMSLGVPVIATNCNSGPLELLNDNEPISIEKGGFYKAKYGLLVNVDDAEGLANAIKHYEANEELRNTFSKLSFQKAKEYDITIIGLQLKKLIDSLCVV